MSNSYKVANVYTEMSLKTNKESVRDFQNQFSGAINNLKQGIAGIGPAGINSMQGLSSIGGSIGNAATGIMGAGGPLVASLGALTGAIASVVSIINSKSKDFKNAFEQDTSMIADMIDKAEGLGVTVGEYQKLKVFAQLKGMDFKQLEQTMLQLNLLSAKVQELGEDADEQTRIYAKIMSGDGKQYSNFQRLELLLRGITQIREKYGQELEYGFYIAKERKFNMEITYYIDYEDSYMVYDVVEAIKQELQQIYIENYNTIGRNIKIQDFYSLVIKIHGLGKVSIKLDELNEKNEVIKSYLNEDIKISTKEIFILNELVIKGGASE